MADLLIGTGETHTTIASWEGATDLDPITEIERGQCKSQTFSENSQPAGATGLSATVYRELHAQSGSEYNPITDTGAEMVDGATQHVIRPDEDFFRTGQLKLEQNSTNSTARRCLRPSDPDQMAYNCFCLHATSTSSNSTSAGLYMSAGSSNFRGYNLILTGDPARTDGQRRGYNNATDLLGVELYNCGVMDTDTGGGFVTDAGDDIIENCWSDGSGQNIDMGASWTGAVNNNMSRDGTADDDGGTGHITNFVEADTFNDVGSLDFRLKDTDSDGYLDGKDLDAKFDDHFSSSISFEPGVDHKDAGGSFNIGPYDGNAATGIAVPIFMHSYRARRAA